MSLSKYNTKRNFSSTEEPEGKPHKASEELRFVVQRHAASHLHYDFRLEMEGMLKSWAIPKGPSLHPADKRLAMMVEDHPFDYRTFEGNIPEGNYGAGEVEIWDEGTYRPLEESATLSDEKLLLTELQAGSLKFVLKGKKLKGEFALVKLKSADQGNAWLLIKYNDKYAVDEDYNAEQHTPKRSKVTKYWEEKTAEKAPKKLAKKSAPALKKASTQKAVAAKKKVLNKK